VGVKGTYNNRFIVRILPQECKKAFRCEARLGRVDDSMWCRFHEWRDLRATVAKRRFGGEMVERPSDLGASVGVSQKPAGVLGDEGAKS
jgi:hypothetical protein